MSVFIDLVILLIFAICVFLGFKRGLVGVVLKLCSFIIALVVSLVLFKPISILVINNTDYDDSIKSYILEIANSESNDNVYNTQNNETKNTPEIIVDYINSSIDKATKEARENVLEYVADSVSKNIISICVFLILFVVLRIVLIFIKIISDAITDLPIVKQLDKSGGIVYGLLQAFLIVYVVFTFITLVIKSPVLEQTINNSYIGSILYNNNLLLMLLFR